MSPKVSRHDHFALYVSDLGRSQAWYQEILGLAPVHRNVWGGKTAVFLGNQDAMVALFQRPPGDKYSSKGMPSLNHQAFRLSRKEYEAFKHMLHEKRIGFSESDHTISHSIYFQDPDDYWIELTTYEPADT